MTKILKTLQKIPTTELSDLDKFLHSPYFNQRSNTIALFHVLRKWHPSFQKFDRQNLWKKLYPKQPFKASQLDKQFYELNQLVLDFLNYQQIRLDTWRRKELRRITFGQHDFYPLFQKEGNEILQELEEKDMLDQDDLLKVWHIKRDLYRHPLTPAKPDPFRWELEAMQALDTFYLIERLRFFLNLQSRTAISPTHPDTPWLNSLIKQAQKIEDQHSLLKLYRLAASFCFQGREMESLQKLLYQLESLTDQVDPLELGILIIQLGNIAYQQYAQGQSEFRDPLFQLFDLGLQQGLFRSSILMKPNVFLNISIVTAAFAETEWYERFIQTHAPYLIPSQRDACVRLASAYHLFHHQHYREARLLVSDLPKHHINFKLRARSLIVRCLLQELLTTPTLYPVFIYEIKAFRKFLRRNQQLSDKRKMAYLAFAHATVHIARLRRDEQNDESSLQQLAKKIQTLNPILLPWLLKILDESGDQPIS